MIKSKKFRPKVKVRRVTADGKIYTQLMTPAHPVETCDCVDCRRIRNKVQDLAFRDTFTSGTGKLITFTAQAEKLPIDGEDYGEQPKFKPEPMSLGDRIIDKLVPDCIARYFEGISFL